MKGPTVLVIPPHLKACEPTPGVLVLASHLEAAGLPARVVDANLAVQEALLAGPALSAHAEALGRSGAAGAALTSARRAANRIDGALAALRLPATYREARRYRPALDALREAFRVVSRARGGRISVSDLDCNGLSPLSSEDLLAAAEDPGLLPIGPELERVVPEILGDGPEPRIVGFSAVYLSQALPAFALAGLLRRAGYGGLLVLGGGLPSSWTNSLRADSPVFRLWDAVVVGPGEHALESLARDLPGPAPGLLMPARGSWEPPSALGRARLAFEPETRDLPWGRYLSPGPVLPLAASRGCYWRRCAFCPASADRAGGFRKARGEDLVRTLLDAADRGFGRVHLTDDAIPPASLAALARGLRDRGVAWYGFVRLTPELLRPRFAEDLARSGCAMLQVGIETASQRLLDLLGKGTRAVDAAPALANLAAASIRTYVYLLFGIPGETAGEADATLAWASENARNVTFLNLAVMNLPRGSPLHREPSRYGVLGLEEFAGGGDLSLYLDYAQEGGRDRRDARRALAAAHADPALREVLQRTPHGFTCQHAAFAPLR